MEVGEIIKQKRKDLGYTQKELADKCEVAEITIRQYETGKRQPKSKILYKIATVLGLNFDKLLGGIQSFDSGESFHKEWNKIIENIDESSDSLTIVHKVALEEKEMKILDHFQKLNDLGKNKAIEQVELLTKIPEYRKDNE